MVWFWNILALIRGIYSVRGKKLQQIEAFDPWFYLIIRGGNYSVWSEHGIVCFILTHGGREDDDAQDVHLLATAGFGLVVDLWSWRQLQQNTLALGVALVWHDVHKVGLYRLGRCVWLWYWDQISLILEEIKCTVRCQSGELMVPLLRVMLYKDNTGGLCCLLTQSLDLEGIVRLGVVWMHRSESSETFYRLAWSC